MESRAFNSRDTFKSPNICIQKFSADTQRHELALQMGKLSRLYCVTYWADF